MPRPEDALRALAQAGATTEYVCECVFRPLAHLVVLALAAAARAAAGGRRSRDLRVGRRRRVSSCARASGRGAALLLQLKTVLDNADGQLARASGRTSVLGRYLDSESDLLVDAALFAALGYVTGRPVPRGRGLRRPDARARRQLQPRAPLPARARASDESRCRTPTGRARLARTVYAVVYAPQDRLGRGVRRVAAASACRPDRTRGSPTTTARRSRCSPTSASRRSWPSSALCLALGAPEPPTLWFAARPQLSRSVAARSPASSSSPRTRPTYKGGNANMDGDREHGRSPRTSSTCAGARRD